MNEADKIYNIIMKDLRKEFINDFYNFPFADNTKQKSMDGIYESSS